MTEPCSICKGEGWVCEDHTDMRFEGCPCEVYAGVPCKACNPCDRDNPPRMQPEFETVIDVDGNRYKPKLVVSNRLEVATPPEKP